MLLSVWLSHCSLAVSQFLSIPSNIPFLTAQAGSIEHDENEELVQGLCSFLMGICIHFNDNSVPSFSKESLCQIVSKRIGVEVFLDKLGEVSKHEQYSKAIKHPQIRPGRPSDLLLDHEFCRLFKALEGLVGKSVSPRVDFLNGADVPDSVLVQQYKELIRDQDSKVQELEKEVDRLRREETSNAHKIQELENTVAQLKDENVLLRAHASSNGADFTVTQDLARQLESHKAELTAQYMTMLAEKDREIRELNEKLKQPDIENSLNNLSISNEVDRLNEELKRERLKYSEAEEKLCKLEEAESELDRLMKDQENLLELLAEQDKKLAEYREKLKEVGIKVEDEDEEADDVCVVMP